MTNPIVYVGNRPMSVIVPLEPRKALFIHETGPGVGPRTLTDDRVRFLNKIQDRNAGNWLVSRKKDPHIPLRRRRTRVRKNSGIPIQEQAGPAELEMPV